MPLSIDAPRQAGRDTLRLWLACAVVAGSFLGSCTLTEAPRAVDVEVASVRCPPYGEPLAPFEVVVLGSRDPASGGSAGAGYVFFVDGAARAIVDPGPDASARLDQLAVSRDELDVVLSTTAGPERATAFELTGASDEVAGVPEQPNPQPTQLFADDSGLVVSALRMRADQAPIAYRVQRGPHAAVVVAGLPDDANALIELARGAGVLIFAAPAVLGPYGNRTLYETRALPDRIGVVARAAGVGAVVLGQSSASLGDLAPVIPGLVGRAFDGPVVFAEGCTRIDLTE